MPHLHVVELDRDIIARLKREFSSERLSIHEGDALKFDFGSLGTGIHVCGNLPYNISSPLLFHLMDYAGSIVDMTFMLQKEVVDRMVAEPGKGGAIKVYGDFSQPDEFENRIRDAVRLRKMTADLMEGQ